MDSAGHIWVDRRKTSTALDTLKKTKDSLYKKPRSILLFPEGTRTLDGSLGSFKKGGLSLSLYTSLPIVPIAFNGTFNLLPKGSNKMISSEVIKLKIGKPFSPDDYYKDNQVELAEYIRGKVQKLL